jgi:heme ABC exporter ATP-binding subunit CcmA
MTTLTNEPSLAIDVARLSKTFGRTPALRRVDFQLGWGEVLALFGHNGAGKSTLIRMLCTLARPDDGSVRIGGFDTLKQAAHVRSVVGYVGHQPLLYEEMSAVENLNFYAKLYRLNNVRGRIERALDEVGATSYADRRVRTLSNGMQKRVAIARALLHRPRVLLLDEPETGLDQAGLDLLDSIINAVKAGGASVLLSTHAAESGLALADRVIVLTDGRVDLSCARSETSVAEVQRAVVGGAR